MGIIGKIAKLRPSKIGLFRYSEPNYLNLHFADGGRAALREWQGLYSYYSTDHLFDPAFVAAFDPAIARDKVPPDVLRLRVFNTIRFGEIALRQQGDVMFCGVSFGVTAYAFSKYHQAAMESRRLVLVDAFEGAYSSADRAPRKMFGADVEEIGKTFPGAKIMRGYIPEILETSAIANRFCFVHLNTTDPVSEVASLDWIDSRMVPGGIIMIDAYSMRHEGSENYPAKLAALGFTVIPLMNGQAACFKGG